MIPVGIVTTARRRESAARTLSALSSVPGLKVTVFEDLEPGLFANHRAAWKTLLSSAPRALLVQDDVTCVRDWYEIVKLFDRTFPSAPVISFFFPFHKGLDDKGRGFVHSTDIWEQAALISRDFYFGMLEGLTPEILQKHEIGRRKGDFHHDEVMCDRLRFQKQKAVISCPPVFQHTNLPSTVGNPTRTKGYERVSKHFPGESAYALDRFRSLNE